MFLFFKENLFQFVLILMLLVILVYVTNITSIPDSIILFEGEDITLQTVSGVKLEEQYNTVNKNTIQASSALINNKVNESINSTRLYDLRLMGVKLKTVTAKYISNQKVIPLGNLIGLKLYTQGVLVVGTSEVEGEDNKKYKPFEDAGIEQGDSIIKINNESVGTTRELLECISKSRGKRIEITYLKDGKEKETNITPVKTGKNTYKLGLWVRDAQAGIGTLTFYDPKTNSIASLGHGIQDVDTEEMVDISSGEFVTSEVINIKQGRSDNPGRIEGSIENGIEIGNIYSNTKFGVYGYLNNNNALNINENNTIEVASRNQIKEEDAKVVCTLEDGKKEEYTVRIQKIFKNNNDNNKSMLVKVTDERLLEKTGGIVQGMSGSPIIQNGKLIGALTHVLVSDPTIGYGVFADLMIEEIQ